MIKTTLLRNFSDVLYHSYAAKTVRIAAQPFDLVVRRVCCTFHTLHTRTVYVCVCVFRSCYMTKRWGGQYSTQKAHKHPKNVFFFLYLAFRTMILSCCHPTHFFRHTVCRSSSGNRDSCCRPQKLRGVRKCHVQYVGLGKKACRHLCVKAAAPLSCRINNKLLDLFDVVQCAISPPLQTCLVFTYTTCEQLY